MAKVMLRQNRIVEYPADDPKETVMKSAVMINAKALRVKEIFCGSVNDNMTDAV